MPISALSLLLTLTPKARDDLRRVLIRDHADRDAIASRLMRYRDQNGQDCADIIDFLTMWPDARRRVARLLGEIDADHTESQDLSKDPPIPVLPWAQVLQIQDRFNLLNPYDSALVPQLLKAEQGSLERELRCYAISAKRYALYRDEVGDPNVITTGDLREDDDSADAWDIAKPSQHGLGHLLNPTDPESDSRDWIGDGWRWLMALDRSSTTVSEPAWLDRPAVAQVSISTPNWWHLFDQWNQDRDYAMSVKPFGFMLVAYADPLRASQEVGRLIHPYERDPRRWLETDWADLYEPGKRLGIGVRRQGDPFSDPSVVYVKTYRDVLLSYLGHPEAKSSGVDGDVCRRDSRGVLTRRPVEAAMVTHIGKESNRLEERLAGLIATEDEFLLQFGDRTLDLLVLPTVRTFAFSETALETGISSSTLADILAGRTKPQRRNARVLREWAFTRSGDWLTARDRDVPEDISRRLSSYLSVHERWVQGIEAEYRASLHLVARSETLTFADVARAAGVSLRRLRSLKDPLLQAAVVDAVGQLTSEMDRSDAAE